MNPEQANQESAQLSKSNPLSTMQPDERIICEIKRHPFGILSIYVGESLLLIALALILLVAVPNFVGGDNHERVMLFGTLLFVVAATVSLAFVFIANTVYWGNRWIVTSDSLTQLSQTSLFKKQSSQLSFNDLEDVSAEQTGMFSDVFHFGTLRAETAGEHSKFVFPFCPKPNYYAQKILAAREVFEQGRREQEPVTQSQPVQEVVVPDQQPPAGPSATVEAAPVYSDQPLSDTSPRPYIPPSPLPNGYDQNTDDPNNY